jgi:signal transduction histidine kinase/CheY-like chemotaxis protein
MAAYQSLRVRLPLVISLLLVAAVTTFLWAAYREVEATLARGGGDRARVAAAQVASLIGRSAQAGIESLRSVAAQRDIREFLRAPTDETRDAARARLAPLATGGVRRIELWSVAGSRVLDVSIPTPASGEVRLPEITAPPAVGFNKVQDVSNVVFADSSAEIVDEPSSAEDAKTSTRLGYVVVRSILSVSPPGLLGRLVGRDAVIEIGNTGGGTWTDLSNVVPAPPVDLTRDGVAEYRAAKGERRLGAVAAIRGTPWAVWVEFPRSIIMAPARVFLTRAIWFALLVLAVGAALVAALSVRITRPLHELARAADQIATGDYSRRVGVTGTDEIGRLGLAFNAMAAEVKTAIDALRSSQRTFAATLANIHDGVAVADAGGTLVYVNPMAERILGTGMVGRRPEESMFRDGLCLPDGSAPVPLAEQPLLRALAGEDVRDVDLFVRNVSIPDGAHINVNAGPLRGSDGISGGAWVSFRDMSLPRQLEEARRRAADFEFRGRAAQHANRLKSEFLANMSHELRTPLNAIIGFTDLMHKGKAGPVSALHVEYLGDVLSSSRHLLQLINDVLDLAKVESGKMDFRPEPVDLAKLVKEVGDILRGLATIKHLTIDVAVHPEVAVAVVDPARVKQILYNYLSNAIKFTPERGRVGVRITPEGPDHFRIDVSDTGIGISVEDLGRLFVEFQQLDTAATKQHQGTGLGLALTKRLAEAQGGHVGVESEAGRGSTFSAILPRVMLGAPADGVTPVIGSPLGSRTILIVDDDPNTVKLAETVLRESGYSPVCAGTAESALLIAQAETPAVVIVDLIMPGVDGFEFVARLRATPAGRQVPIIVWTVKDLEADERRRLQSSTVTIVAKRLGGSQTLVEELRRIAPLMHLASKGNA